MPKMHEGVVFLFFSSFFLPKIKKHKILLTKINTATIQEDEKSSRKTEKSSRAVLYLKLMMTINHMLCQLEVHFSCDVGRSKLSVCVSSISLVISGRKI